MPTLLLHKHMHTTTITTVCNRRPRYHYLNHFGALQTLLQIPVMPLVLQLMLAYTFDSSTQKAKVGGPMKASQGHTVRLCLKKQKQQTTKKVLLPRNGGLLISQEAEAERKSCIKTAWATV